MPLVQLEPLTLEPVYAALFAFLSAIADNTGVRVFATTSRLLQTWENYEQFPVLQVVEMDEDEQQRGPMGLTRIEARCGLVLYYQRADDALSSPIANLLIGYVRAALKGLQLGPDGNLYQKPIGSKQTLGGLVENCYIKGKVVIDEGVLDKQGCVFVPVVFIMGDVPTPRP